MTGTTAGRPTGRLGRRRPSRADVLTAESIALRSAAALLGYPDQELRECLPVFRQAAARLPGAAREPLLRFVDYLQAADPLEAAMVYVDTFDLRRRCCPYLTYYAHGDTRKRGMALTEFTATYRAAGAVFCGDELPDHLSVVCEFAADHPGAGRRLLSKHRAGVELLRMALADAGSAYVDVVDVVRAVLPDAAPRDLQRALALARSGPPAEEVGLEPFAPPEEMEGRR